MNEQAAIQKKSNSNLNAGATPAADPSQDEPQTPATPISSANPASFSKAGQTGGAQPVSNGPPTAVAAPAPPAPSAPVSHPDPNHGSFAVGDAGGMVRLAETWLDRTRG